jgi:CBS domain-containing protein
MKALCRALGASDRRRVAGWVRLLPIDITASVWSDGLDEIEVAQMLIADLLRHKGSAVVTITPADSVSTLLALLAEHKVGALVVVRNDGIVGIVSERDIVRHLNDRGAAVLEAPVSDLMTEEVLSAKPEDSIDDIGGLMTERRIRHMPVIANGKLAGIVTIGDVVAARIRQLEQDRGQLEHYITQG